MPPYGGLMRSEGLTINLEVYPPPEEEGIKKRPKARRSVSLIERRFFLEQLILYTLLLWRRVNLCAARGTLL